MIGRAARIVPIAVVAAFAIWAALFFAFAPSLPDKQTLWRPQQSPGLVVLAHDGRMLAARGAYNAAFVGVRQLPDHLVNAVLATEDRRFYDHFGVDVSALVRAGLANVRAGGIVQGGSTITQQLAKNLFLSQDRTLLRKIQELYLAVWLETQLTKDEILSLYLNRVYLGAGTYGVEAASQRYFGHSAREVSLLEAAVVAGLLKAPSRYAPTSDLERARARAGVVLDAMVDAGALAPAARDQARAAPLRLAQPAGSRDVGYVVDWIEAQLPQFAVTPTGGDLIVETTLDAEMQGHAEAAVHALLEREGEVRNITQAALVALAPDGAVRAMVGGRSYVQSQFNRAVMAERQPGSAFKPFVFLAALEAGWRPTDSIEDAPIALDGWRPQNLDGRFRGRVTLTEALAASLNAATVSLSERVGRAKVAQVAHRMGIRMAGTPHPSAALGTSATTLLDLTAAYAPFVNDGRATVPYAVRTIRDRRGIILFHRGESPSPHILAGASLGAMNGMLAEALHSGTGRRARLPDRPAAGKTGTSQDFRDAWFVGYTADLVAGVWTGNDDEAPMRGVTGGGAPAALWRSFMVAATAGLPVRPLPVGRIADAPAIAATSPVGEGGPGFIDGIVRWLRAAGEPASGRTSGSYISDKPIDHFRETDVQ